MKRDDLLRTANEWHGGQSSPLYSFASTGGTVHSAAHRDSLMAEIAENITDATGQGSWRALQGLAALADHIERLEGIGPRFALFPKS